MRWARKCSTGSRLRLYRPAIAIRQLVVQVHQVGVHRFVAEHRFVACPGGAADRGKIRRLKMAQRPVEESGAITVDEEAVATMRDEMRKRAVAAANQHPAGSQ